MSLRAAKRRSNLAGEGIHTGLLRSARNDGRIKSVKIRAIRGPKFLSC
ncbi:MAG: hypothetical protein LBT00_02080 [Spirochaetaceae bacterium]|nr:hypothetical protein [Spirochaetaceae bacterium]